MPELSDERGRLMRLNELHVDGFGHFRDHVVGPLDSDVTVLHGPNEAGKSTLLAFIRTILFGFPLRGRDDHYPPFAGGRHGGRITLIDDDGESYTLERIAGPRGGRPVLRADSGEEAALERLIGHASPDLFSNVFAFSLEEIQSGELMNDSEVSGRLYSVGMGASGLPELNRSLTDRRSGLYRQRGSAQKIPGLLNELTEIDGRLRVIQGNADEYRRLNARQEVILLELDEAETEISRLNIRQSEVGKLLDGWDDWVVLEGLEAQLREVPEIERLPESPIERLEAIEERVRQATEDRDDAARELRRICEAAAAAMPGEELLNDSERVEAVRRSRGSFDDSVRDLPERRDELRQMEDLLSERLRELGGARDETSLDGLDTSLATRQHVEAWKERLIQSKAMSDAAAVRLDQASGQLEELRSEERQAQDKLQVDSASAGSIVLRPVSGRQEDLLEDREDVERVRRGRGSFDDSVRDLPERRAELGAQESDIASQLRDLGQGWDESRLDGFDISMVFRHEVDEFRQRVSDQSARERSTAQQLERERSELVERGAAVEHAQARVPAKQPALDGPAIDRRRSALRAARSRLNDHERASLNLENLRGQLRSLTGSGESADTVPRRSSALLPVLLGVAGIILILVGVYLGQEALFIGVVAGVVLLGVAVYLAVRNPSTPVTAESSLAGAIDQGVSEARTALEGAEELLVEAAQPLGLDAVPTADVLDNVEADLEAASNALSAWNESNRRVEEARLELEAQERRVEQADGRARSAVESETAVRSKWRRWLQGHGLDEGLTPEGVVEFTGRIETSRAVLESVRRMRQRVSAIELDIDEYGQLVQPLAEKYGIPLEDADHQRVMAVADTLIESFDTIRELVVQRDDVLARLRHQEQSVSSASEEHESALQELEDGQLEWRGWLRECQLEESFTPDTLLEFLARADTARAQRNETRRMRQRVSAIEVDIDQFRDRVAPLAQNHGVTLDTADPPQLAAAADTLIDRLEEVRVQVSERDQVRQQGDQQRGRLEQMELRVQSAEESLAGLLAMGDAGDAEEFRRRAALYGQRRELEAQRDKRLGSLSRLSGPSERLAVFRASLAASDQDLLRDEIRVLSDRIDTLNSRRDELNQEHGGNATEVDRLAAEEESSELRIRRNVLMEKLREDAREWSRLTIASVILDRTQRKFEQERQPNVIRYAEEFFSKVTGHRYTRLYAPVGERTITVTHVSGRNRRPEELSRGTREQLYLALRFGLIREFGEHAERLPVVVDEALVNFDPERASLAASAFSSLSETNQVLVFTCHRAIADTFADVGAHVVDIGPPSS